MDKSELFEKLKAEKLRREKLLKSSTRQVKDMKWANRKIDRPAKKKG